MIKVDKRNFLEGKRVNNVYYQPEESVVHLLGGTFVCSRSCRTRPTSRPSRQCAFQMPLCQELVLVSW